jgi:hypothetical protein
MELLPPPDFFDSIDFNLLTAEIFHQEEHDCDWTLTDGDKMPLEWRDDSESEEVDEVFDEQKREIDGENLETPNNDDAKKDDEPKVDEN